MSALGRSVDLLLEASVVGSFSRIGCVVRSRTDHWTPAPRGEGKVAIVTGASSGIGEATAAALASLGWTVWLAGRDPGRLEAARVRILDQHRQADLHVVQADLADLADVRVAARHLREQLTRLDVLVHNAGSLGDRYEVTPDGVELTAQVHLVAPFLLTSELLPLLRSTPGARVITVSSGGMYLTSVDVADLTTEPERFDGVRTYARTKRAQVVLSEVWAREPEATGVAFHAMHPGWAATPGLAKSLPRFGKLLGPLLRNAAEGADTVVWLATADPALLGTGRFWHDRRPRTTVRIPGTGLADSTVRALWDWIRASAFAPNAAEVAGRPSS